jgi:hypothetical protein
MEAGVWRNGALETPMLATATTRAAEREAERSAAAAGAAVRLLRKEIEGSTGPPHSLTGPSCRVPWGEEGADSWPWDETLALTDVEGEGDDRNSGYGGGGIDGDRGGGRVDGGGGGDGGCGGGAGAGADVHPSDEWKAGAVLFAQRLGAHIRRGVTKGVHTLQRSEQVRTSVHGIRGFLGKLGGGGGGGGGDENSGGGGGSDVGDGGDGGEGS